METPGIMSQFELIADDGESELIGFNHGPDCECGSVLNLFRDHWEELGSPTIIAVSVFPMDYEPAPTIRGVVQGPWGQL